MSDKFLIVNADDLGFALDVNAAIESVHRQGSVTNATLMVDGPCVADALEVIHRNPQLSVGLHLDLCPVLGLYEIPYPQMRQSAATPEVLAKVAAEVDRQIIRFQSFGLEFTHLDGHRHFHALPEVFSTVIETAARRGLRTIRLTQNWILPRTPSVLWSDEFFDSAVAILRCFRVRCTDHFIYGWKPYSEDDFGGGWNELMTHVGADDEAYRREYDLLASSEFERRIRASRVQLKTYRDLAAAAERTVVS